MLQLVEQLVGWLVELLVDRVINQPVGAAKPAVKRPVEWLEVGGPVEQPAGEQPVVEGHVNIVVAPDALDVTAGTTAASTFEATLHKAMINSITPNYGHN